MPKVTGFTCGASWTIQVVGEVPDDASDQTVPFGRRPDISDRVLCSFAQDGVGAITAHADVENGAVVFRIPGAADISVKPDSSSAERFFFTRGSAIFLAVTCSYNSGTGNATYTPYASVGHTTAQSPYSVTATHIQPDHIYFCGADGSLPECMLWWGGGIDESAALGSSSIVSAWSGLTLLFQRVIFLPPWGEED
jgi:hypothetical protein